MITTLSHYYFLFHKFPKISPHSIHLMIPEFGMSVISSPLSSNVPIILKIPFSSLDDYTVLALKTNNDRATKIGSNVLIDGNVNALYLNSCLSKGKVSVLLIGNTEQGETVKSYSSSQVTSADNHIPIRRQEGLTPL